jgi:hypothetical protein
MIVIGKDFERIINEYEFFSVYIFNYKINLDLDYHIYLNVRDILLLDINILLI